MKTTCRFIKVVLTLAVCLSAITTAQGVELANTPTNASASEDLGSDFYNGKSYRIGKVTEVKPAYVQVIYADVPRGRKIPRACPASKIWLTCSGASEK